MEHQISRFAQAQCGWNTQKRKKKIIRLGLKWPNDTSQKLKVRTLIRKGNRNLAGY